MQLSDRKKKILQTVVDTYIEHAVPISSKAINEIAFDEISSATIRSELATLEDMGFLIKPHTSAGRVPSSLAYKFYVDNLLDVTDLRKEEVKHIEQYFEGQKKDIETVVKSAAKVLSDMTDYTSLAVVPSIKDEIVEKVRLIKIDDKKAFLLIILGNGTVKNTTVDLPIEANDTSVETAGNLLNQMLSHKKISQIASTTIEEISAVAGEAIKEYTSVFRAAIDFIKIFTRDDNVEVEGREKILKFPEYSDVRKANEFMDMLNDHKTLRHATENTEDGIKLVVKIGGEDEGVPEGCAMIVANYNIGGKNLGGTGVIGPDRMNYGKVISVIKCINNILKDINEKEK